MSELTQLTVLACISRKTLAFPCDGVTVPAMFTRARCQAVLPKGALITRLKTVWWHETFIALAPICKREDQDGRI